jgi:hypothetical protein
LATFASQHLHHHDSLVHHLAFFLPFLTTLKFQFIFHEPLGWGSTTQIKRFIILFFKFERELGSYQCWAVLIRDLVLNSIFTLRIDCSYFEWKPGWKLILRFSAMWEPTKRIGTRFLK